MSERPERVRNIQEQVLAAWRGSGKLNAVDESVAEAVRVIADMICDHQDVLPAKESAKALIRLEGLLTALEAMFIGADWICDGNACVDLREEVRAYRDSLEVV